MNISVITADAISERGIYNPEDYLRTLAGVSTPGGKALKPGFLINRLVDMFSMWNNSISEINFVQLRLTDKKSEHKP